MAYKLFEPINIRGTEFKNCVAMSPMCMLTYDRWMKEQDIDLIDCSSGGIAPVKVNAYPNYQVPAADLLQKKLHIATGAVGLLESGRQAEEILQNQSADMVFIGRAMLRDPFWTRTAADELDQRVEVPEQYTRYSAVWQSSLPPLAPAPMRYAES